MSPWPSLSEPLEGFCEIFGHDRTTVPPRDVQHLQLRRLLTENAGLTVNTTPIDMTRETSQRDEC